MNFAIETNGTYSDQIPACSSAPSRAAPFIRMTPNDHRENSLVLWRSQAPSDLDTPEAGNAASQTCEVPGDRPEVGGEAVGFGLAVLAVIGLGALGGWAIVQLMGSLVHVQSLVVQNAFLAHR